MTESPTPAPQAALAALATVFRALGVPAMIIGGVAVIARGVPRMTVDVDAVVQADGLDLEALWRELGRAGFEPRIPNAREFANQRQVLLLVHHASGMALDLSLGWLPFECDALARATPVDLDGVSVPVATAEDLIVFKAIGWRDRDKWDIEELFARHRTSIDLARVRTTVLQLLHALDEPERMAEFDALVRRALADPEE